MLRKLGIVLLILIAIPVGWLGSAFAYEWWNTYTHRFRITIDVETPEGIKSSSSVIQSSITGKADWVPQASGTRESVRGEAIVIDLGNGRSVIGALGFGPSGSQSELYNVAARAFERNKAFWYREAPAWEGRAELSGDLIPTLITFSDINDPKTARVVQPHEFPQVFGEGVRFRRATIEMTRNAVTREIERKMPTLLATLREQAQKPHVIRVGDPFRVSSGHFER